MKKILLFTALFISHFVSAQHYQCLQSGVKHYFTNSYGYLRGIRIDSVKAMGDTTVYYPFHTLRGRVNSSGLGGSIFDIGGSWVGEKVLDLSNGTFLFDNLLGNTVIIKTQANTGDSWVFYSDTTTRYYQAKVASEDTMTVFGFVDSIKKILVTAYDSSGIVTTDPANNLQITLSKDFGFVQIFDLYTFPYHEPDSNYNENIDYFLSIVSQAGGSYAPNYNSATFLLTPFFDPPLTNIYDFAAGDVIENSFMRTDITGYPLYGGFIIDSFLSKTVISDTQNSYIFHEWNLQSAIGTPPFSSVTFSSDSVNIFATPLIDTSLMPEEAGQLNIYYYYPEDSNYCYVSDRYIIFSGVMYNTFEPCGEENEYKIGKGNTISSNCYNPPQDGYNTSLFYSNKNGIACGAIIGVPNSVYNVTGLSGSVHLTPNPATTTLTITSSATITQIVITDLLGQSLYTGNYATTKADVDIAGLPPGVYLVRINGSVVREFVKE